MAEEKYYADDEELDRADRLYSVRDPEYQNAAVSYMYGADLAEAARMREHLSEADIANACDYMKCRGLPPGEKQAYYQKLVDDRVNLSVEQNLGPIEAIITRDMMAAEEFERVKQMTPTEMKLQEEFMDKLRDMDFENAVGSIPTDGPETGIKQ